MKSLPLSTTIPNIAPSAEDSVSEYWVARVVRQMKGCSPSKIDSVIQANLPPRKIKWSQRPDTLEIPGIEGRVPYSIELEHGYELGFFKENPLLHPEIVVGPNGKMSEPLVHQHQNNDKVATLTLGCFLLLTLIIRFTRSFTSFQMKGFFQQAKKRESNNSIPPTAGTAFVGMTYLLLSLMGGILFYLYAQGKYDLFFCQVSKPTLYAYYVGCFFIFFCAKYLFTKFINWIFFDKTSRENWRQTYVFLLIAESILLLPVVIQGVFLNLSSEITMLLAIIAISIIKLALLYKTFSIFLPKIYCILHLLSYLCALEIIPLLALGVSLIGITERLSLIF